MQVSEVWGTLLEVSSLRNEFSILGIILGSP